MSTPNSPIGQLSGPVVLTGVVPGYAIIPSPTPLTFLNYYDGKFLQASDLRQEQLGLLSTIQLSNRANGTPGPGYGFDVATGVNDTLTLGPGLGIDQQGRVLYLPQSVRVPVSDLLASMQAPGGPGRAAADSASGTAIAGGAFQPCELATAPPSATPVSGTELYLITLSAAEGLCGTDEVFGRLCDAACVTASDRPWRIEGVLLGLVPLTVGQLATSTSVVLTQAHLRSQVASAYFAAEATAGGSLISAAGLGTGTWCLGAEPIAGDVIPLGVLARSGGSTVFLDEWTARRERIDTSPQRYWDFRMARRPWNTFLAQVLQFQCQLVDAVKAAATVGQAPANSLSQAITLLKQGTTLLDELGPPGSTAPAEPTGVTPSGPTLEEAVADFRQKVGDVLAGDAIPSAPTLVDYLVDTAPAGFLPVDLTADTGLEAQVSQLFGAGVDLRFCVMRHDEVGSQLARAQHLDRISLLAGLDDPSQKQQVDVYIPDGTWQTTDSAAKAEPSIKATLDWVLFRRRSDVNCSPPPLQLDTVTLYALSEPSDLVARRQWPEVKGGKGQPLGWVRLGDLQFDTGTGSLVTPAATVQGWWTAAGIATRLFGMAYAPAASTDQVALARAGNLATALAPTASGQPVFAAIANSPRAIEPGTVGALFAVAEPATVTVGVWITTLQEPEADQEWAFITGGGKATDTNWSSAGTAVLTLDTPPRVIQWTGAPAAAGDPLNVYAGYSPGALATGEAGVRAMIDQAGWRLADSIKVVANPPEDIDAGQDGSVFVVVPTALT